MFIFFRFTALYRCCAFFDELVEADDDDVRVQLRLALRLKTRLIFLVHFRLEVLEN